MLVFKIFSLKIMILIKLIKHFPFRRQAFLFVSLQYNRDLKSGLVLILNGQNEVGLQVVWILNGIWNLEAILDLGKWQPFSQTPFRIRTEMSGFWIVWFLNGWGTIAIDKVKAWSFEIRLSRSLDFRSSLEFFAIKFFSFCL